MDVLTTKLVMEEDVIVVVVVVVEDVLLVVVVGVWTRSWSMGDGAAAAAGEEESESPSLSTRLLNVLMMAKKPSSNSPTTISIQMSPTF